MTHEITDAVLKTITTRAYEQGYDIGYTLGHGIALVDGNKSNPPKPSDLSQNCWRPIDEYDETKYDWVLVRQADAFDKFVPTVAEKRKDGKWYDQNDNQLPYEVVEFFDMQRLNGKTVERGGENIC